MIVAGQYIDGTLMLIAIFAGASVSMIATVIYMTMKQRGARPRWREEREHPYARLGNDTNIFGKRRF